MNPRSELPRRSQIHDRSCLAGGGTQGRCSHFPKRETGDMVRNTIASPLRPALLPTSRFLLNLVRSHLARKPGKYSLQKQNRK